MSEVSGPTSGLARLGGVLRGAVEVG